MADLTDQILPDILATQFNGLPENAGWVLPNVSGRSLLNLPASICRLLDLPEWGASPLAGNVLEPLGGGIRHVILLVVDGMGLDFFRRSLAEQDPPIWAELAAGGQLSPLTSVTPSTTATVLTTLWTGVGPAAHGVLGFEVWLKEFGQVANMIFHSAASASKDTGGLRRSGFQAETFLPVTTLGPHLAANGGKAYSYLPQHIAGSGLTLMHSARVDVFGYKSPADLWVSLAQAMDRPDAGPTYSYVYWPTLDELAHVYGPADSRLQAEWAAFSQILARELIVPLARRTANDTLLIVTADHGQLDTPPNPVYELSRHPELTRRLAMLPTGEARLPYLFTRHGQLEAVSEYIEQAWPDEFAVISAPTALQAGLFGPPPYHPEVLDRLGDLVLLPRGNAYLRWSAGENRLRGRHGGLSHAEMLVPCFAVRL